MSTETAGLKAARHAVLERIEALLNAEAEMDRESGKYDGFAVGLTPGSATWLALDALIAEAREAVDG